MCRTWVRESFSRFEEDGAEIEALKVARTFDLTSRPGWTRFLVTLIFANNYFMAGLSKLCASGVAWTAAENLKAKLLQTTLTQTSWGVWKPTSGSGRPDATLKLVSLAQNEVFSAHSLRPSARLCFQDLRKSGTDPSRQIRSQWTMVNVS